MTKANIESEIDMMMLNAVAQSAKETVTSVLTEEEASEITLDLIGHKLDDLSLEVQGPEKLVKKVEAVLAS